MIVFFLPDALLSRSLLDGLGAAAGAPCDPPDLSGFVPVGEPTIMTAPTRKSESAPSVPPGLGGEFFPLAERNAIYAESVKLATVCVGRSIIPKTERANAALTLANQCYTHVMTNVQASKRETAAVIVEVFQSITETMRRKSLEEYPVGFFMEHFALSFAMLVDIASGEPERLRPVPPPRSKTAKEAMDVLLEWMRKQRNGEGRVNIHEGHVVVDVEPDKTGGAWCVDLEWIPDHAALLKFTVDLASKTWADAETVGMFILQVATAKGWELYKKADAAA